MSSENKHPFRVFVVITGAAVLLFFIWAYMILRIEKKHQELWKEYLQKQYPAQYDSHSSY